MNETKFCTKCKTDLPLDAFSARKARNGRPRSMCRRCTTAATQDWARRNPEKYKANVERQTAKQAERRKADPEYRQRLSAYTKQWQEANYDRYRELVEAGGIRNRYGITVDEAKEMLAAQGGKCALCEREITWENRHIDHTDTADGPVVRGILCARCNTGLGYFLDDPELMRKAAVYVERFIEVKAP